MTPLKQTPVRDRTSSHTSDAARPGTAAHRTHEGAHRNGGRPRRQRSDQIWPAFSRAEQQVSTSRRVTTYGSTLAFGRRSSM